MTCVYCSALLSSASVLLPPFLPALENYLLHPDWKTEISLCGVNSWWFTLTAASETLPQSHLCRTRWESQDFIYSLFPLNPFHRHWGLWKDHQSVSHRAIAHRQTLTVIFLLNKFPAVWEESRASWGNPSQKLRVCTVKHLSHLRCANIHI